MSTPQEPPRKRAASSAAKAATTRTTTTPIQPAFTSNRHVSQHAMEDNEDDEDDGEGEMEEASKKPNSSSSSTTRRGTSREDWVTKRKECSRALKMLAATNDPRELGLQVLPSIPVVADLSDTSPPPFFPNQVLRPGMYAYACTAAQCQEQDGEKLVEAQRRQNGWKFNRNIKEEKRKEVAQAEVVRIFKCEDALNPRTILWRAEDMHRLGDVGKGDHWHILIVGEADPKNPTLSHR